MQNPLVETHIVGFGKDIYGKKIHIELIEKIRDIKRFSNLMELSNAIAKDVEHAVKRLHSYK
jgi:riboflavin kinase/FMN adenylyltransferase